MKGEDQRLSAIGLTVKESLAAVKRAASLNRVSKLGARRGPRNELFQAKTNELARRIVDLREVESPDTWRNRVNSAARNDTSLRLDRRTPLVLVPLRLQLRNFDIDGRRVLRIIVSPTLQSLDDSLGPTEPEVQAGQAFWESVDLLPAGDSEAGTALVQQLISEVGARRVFRVLEMTKPGGDPEALCCLGEKIPARVLGLPERLQARGYNADGSERFHVVGKAIDPIRWLSFDDEVESDSALLDPTLTKWRDASGRERSGDGLSANSLFAPSRPKRTANVYKEGTLEWARVEMPTVVSESTEFSALEAAGFGLEVELPGTQPLDPVARILVTGLATSGTAAQQAELFSEILNEHRLAGQLEFVDVATPTNNDGPFLSGFDGANDAAVIWNEFVESGNAESTADREPNLPGAHGPTIPIKRPSVVKERYADLLGIAEATWRGVGGDVGSEADAAASVVGVLETAGIQAVIPEFQSAGLSLSRYHPGAYLRPFRIDRTPYSVLPLANTRAADGLSELRIKWLAVSEQRLSVVKSGSPSTLTDVLKLQAVSSPEMPVLSKAREKAVGDTVFRVSPRADAGAIRREVVEEASSTPDEGSSEGGETLVRSGVGVAGAKEGLDLGSVWSLLTSLSTTATKKYDPYRAHREIVGERFALKPDAVLPLPAPGPLLTNADDAFLSLPWPKVPFFLSRPTSINSSVGPPVAPTPDSLLEAIVFEGIQSARTDYLREMQRAMEKFHGALLYEAMMLGRFQGSGGGFAPPSPPWGPYLSQFAETELSNRGHDPRAMKEAVADLEIIDPGVFVDGFRAVEDGTFSSWKSNLVLDGLASVAIGSDIRGDDTRAEIKDLPGFSAAELAVTADPTLGYASGASARLDPSAFEAEARPGARREETHTMPRGAGLVVNLPHTKTVGNVPYNMISGLPISQSLTNIIAGPESPTARYNGFVRGLVSHLIQLRSLGSRVKPWMVMETLDALSHRLDTIATGRGFQALLAQREQDSSGIYLGAYGMVEAYDPNENVAMKVAGRWTAPASRGGFLVCPNPVQAKAAAALRSSYLAFEPGQEGPFSMQLASEDVRAGVYIARRSNSSSLSWVVGERFERLRREEAKDYDIPLKDFLEAFPLPEAAPTKTPSLGVVPDGGAIVESWLAHQSGGTSIDWYCASVKEDAEPDISAAVDRICKGTAEYFDHASDLILHEQVCGLMAGELGRVQRYSAALEGEADVPEFKHVKQGARSGHRYTTRLICSLAAGPSDWAGANLLSSVYPELSRWVESLVGSPNQYSFGVRGWRNGLPYAWSFPVSEVGVGVLAWSALTDKEVARAFVESWFSTLHSDVEEVEVLLTPAEGTGVSTLIERLQPIASAIETSSSVSARSLSLHPVDDEEHLIPLLAGANTNVVVDRLRLLLNRVILLQCHFVFEGKELPIGEPATSFSPHDIKMALTELGALEIASLTEDEIRAKAPGLLGKRLSEAVSKSVTYLQSIGTNLAGPGGTAQTSEVKEFFEIVFQTIESPATRDESFDVLKQLFRTLCGRKLPVPLTFQSNRIQGFAQESMATDAAYEKAIDLWTGLSAMDERVRNFRDLRHAAQSSRSFTLNLWSQVSQDAEEDVFGDETRALLCLGELNPESDERISAILIANDSGDAQQETLAAGVSVHHQTPDAQPPHNLLVLSAEDVETSSDRWNLDDVFRSLNELMDYAELRAYTPELARKVDETL